MSELKPCPFCGGEAEAYVSPAKDGWNLLPCPFCPDGGEVVFKDGWQRDDGLWINGFVRCNECRTVRWSKDISDFLGTWRHGFVSDEVAHECSLTAIEAWNTRHERTCELIKHAALDEESGIELVLYECGQCGWIVDPSRNERYCPNCGIRVRRDDE